VEPKRDPDSVRFVDDQAGEGQNLAAFGRSGIKYLQQDFSAALESIPF
jgi:hypothetical protein